ncbi:MAG: NAD(P)-binding protein [Azospirillaceae bacterium]
MPDLPLFDPPRLNDGLPALPPRLAERVTPLNDRPVAADGRYVLYWMRTAVRGHDNPALDAALALARALGLPAFVYHALDERYPYASDRHHTFILEGARDVAAELAARGIGYAFHLSRPGHRGPHLKTLAGAAACTVTEDMPTAPMRRWAEALAGAAPGPVLALDTACTLPMRLVGRAHDRAFAFRKATKEARALRLEEGWSDVAPPGPAFLPDLPFAPMDLASADIPALVAECEIDHGVGPVPHTPGGSRAGYARWADFRDTRLARYARRRNDALDRTAVSRMSAYLHYGQVSPFRLAREAMAKGGDGAEKVLDEMLVWRELAHVFCRFTPDPDSLDAIPDWARESLARAEFDRRDALASWETLARARTGEPLWDAAQLSLLRQGELHNNLRMTWGKEILAWTPDAATALDRLVDLNHRYALDGRDPNSYGGLLWCLGAFDRPFDPPKPVFGRVRARSAAVHARRLDPEAFRASVAAPAIVEAAGRAPPIAVIGAGIAGLAAARTLADHGYAVRVHDKGRGPGGRLSTRRGQDGTAFDHGAQYFTADDPRFARFVESWVDDGVAARWEAPVARLAAGRAEPAPPRRRFVGTPGMSAVIRHLAGDLDVAFGRRIGSVEAAPDGGWRLVAAADEGDGDEPAEQAEIVLVCTPAPQAGPLLAPAPELARAAGAASMAPCWAVMAWFGDAVALPGDPPPQAAFVEDSPLAWIARDSAKPGRPAGECWVLHATPAWSAEHLEETPEEIVPALLDAFADAVGGSLPPAVGARGHRWRHARVIGPAPGPDALFDPALGLGAAGDWCRGPRIEDAWLSGVALAGRVLGAIAGTAPVTERAHLSPRAVKPVDL